jgi:hypothetical protein
MCIILYTFTSCIYVDVLIYFTTLLYVVKCIVIYFTLCIYFSHFNMLPLTGCQVLLAAVHLEVVSKSSCDFRWSKVKDTVVEGEEIFHNQNIMILCWCCCNEVKTLLLKVSFIHIPLLKKFSSLYLCTVTHFYVEGSYKNSRLYRVIFYLLNYFILW